LYQMLARLAPALADRPEKLPPRQPVAWPQ
jgi:hypothetical protein